MELMSQGLIQHSNSLFASPVVLVVKKDGTWRMCVDYRALNQVTIKDKFPVPLTKELLDELDGSEIYSSDRRKSRISPNKNVLARCSQNCI